ncbi:hypothetical protein QYM36_015309 [Artemia franciscana]|uniref:Uncharacterized protein n=1 Tax=Artemia franciscana TaxID=6661 RepID=A0AA88HBY4_ARTSF|nr:hypothetical protein QYM36_015309 [Artemia franciscana]
MLLVTVVTEKVRRPNYCVNIAEAEEESLIKYYNLAKKRLIEEEDEWSSGRDIPHSFSTAEEENGRAELGERASPLGAEDTNERSNFEDKRPEPTGEESGQKMVATSSNEVVEEGILRPEPIGEAAVADGMVLNIPVGPNGSANISPPESNEVNENIPKRIKED